MPTPPKPFTVLKSEKKSHRTKQELKVREEGEKSLATGLVLNERSEVANNSVAHAEFIRLNGLLTNIGKNDAIYEIIINRYCLMVAECSDLEDKRERIYQSAGTLEKALEEARFKEEVKYSEVRSAARAVADIYATMIECDRQVQAKRKMLLDIEKENIMTIAAALRSIPKKPENKKNALLEALGGD
jgi:hypothetical protein